MSAETPLIYKNSHPLSSFILGFFGLFGLILISMSVYGFLFPCSLPTSQNISTDYVSPANRDAYGEADDQNIPNGLPDRLLGPGPSTDANETIDTKVEGTENYIAPSSTPSGQKLFVTIPGHRVRMAVSYPDAVKVYYVPLGEYSLYNVRLNTLNDADEKTILNVRLVEADKFSQKRLDGTVYLYDKYSDQFYSTYMGQDYPRLFIPSIFGRTNQGLNIYVLGNLAIPYRELEPDWSESHFKPVVADITSHFGPVSPEVESLIDEIVTSISFDFLESKG